MLDSTAPVVPRPPRLRPPAWLVVLALVCWVAAILADVWFPHLQSDVPAPLLAVVLAGLTYLGSSVRAPASLERGGRVSFMDLTLPGMFAAAILLPPVWLLVVVFASGPGRRTMINGSVRLVHTSAAGITFAFACATLTRVGGDLGGQAAEVAALAAAGLVMLVVESVLVSLMFRRFYGLDAIEAPLLPWHEMVRDSPDIAIGALACVLLTRSPAALVFLPLVYLLKVQYLGRHAAALTSWRDGKTGLLSLAAFEQLAAAELSRARRHRRHVSVLMLDLDGMKSVNRTFGHLVGDQMLAHAASALAAEGREEDLIARFGGDEFSILLPDTPAPGAEAAAQRLLDAVLGAQLVLPDGRVVRVTVSVGVAESTDDDDVPTLLTRADRGLKRAKETGRNRVCVETLATSGAD